ncbi:2Fe-2S iron-sulfur cluster-binding protein [Sphingopyxis sp. CCNWLW253]|uniref:2Fe-2S iron-sulfur cluster-binding protein n=1 Tax=unclassified Sphingopyxis TaxID=2614943 RepID=UPI003012BEDC
MTKDSKRPVDGPDAAFMPGVDGDGGFHPRVRFISASGETTFVEGRVGQSLMEAARGNGVDAIIGECGGCCACATCHVYIDAQWRDVVGRPSEDEDAMLDFASDRRPESRLSCQIRLRPELHGLIVTTPASQG